jgi:hypothetical protein
VSEWATGLQMGGTRGMGTETTRPIRDLTR